MILVCHVSVFLFYNFLVLQVRAVLLVVNSAYF